MVATWDVMVHFDFVGKSIEICNFVQKLFCVTQFLIFLQMNSKHVHGMLLISVFVCYLIRKVLQGAATAVRVHVRADCHLGKDCKLVTCYM